MQPLLPLDINDFGSQAFRLRLGPTPLAPLHLAFGFEEELRHQCSGPPASQLQIAELLSLHNHVTFIKKFSLHIFISAAGSVFLEKTD